MQQCSKCKETKAFTEFSKRSDTKSGFRKDCKSCSKFRFQKWYENNTHKVIMQSSEWAKTNSNRRTQINNKYASKRRKTDESFALSFRLRNRVREALRNAGISKKAETAKIVGMSGRDLLNYLWNKFEMDYGLPRTFIGLSQVHVDHIVPLASAKTQEEVLKLNHYTNLQFLLIEDNLSKGARL